MKNNIGKREIEYRVWDEDSKKSFGVGMIRVNNVFSEGVAYGLPVMKYTGLKDNNGKSAFDGDIILSRTGGGKPIRKGVIFFDDECGSWYVKFENDEEKEFQVLLCNSHLKLEPDGKDYGVFEIIGNIFENKNLLEI